MDSIEIQEILVSVLLIALAFSIGTFSFEEIVGGKTIVHRGLGAMTLEAFWVYFVITLVTVGLGFVLHELAHRQVAKSYGAYAIYKAWPMGLGIMMFLALSGSPFLFAAPGAVYIYSQYISRKENGIISIAGPMTNLALALFFGLLLLLLPGGSDVANLMHRAFYIGMKVNTFLALFNMIPIFPLDGSKVWAWDQKLWISFMVVAGILFLFG